ncbi:hypothetical protein GO988_05695 [Hymenobacter sp. HMF4947]|uniref:Uncharacterized protein n=1 Tax=Hymenobacter ginkgonis TaxID=2682976 RepID=A0A7K1TBQ2_9BACT|nr:hypothetical protein [Hymenobacter ginkgonis]MVN75815.1 hypothetical protein [Hymenobacter ginkgonis]
MKSNLYTALSLLVSSGLSQTTWAQTAPPAQNATELTREMSNRLHLNEGEYVKLYTLNRTRLTLQDEIERNTKNDSAARTAQLAELQSQYEQECGRIMSPTQLSQLLQQETSQLVDGSST